MSDICQIDGNVTYGEEIQHNQSKVGTHIPVHISQHRISAQCNFETRVPVIKTLKRNNVVLQAIELPVVMNINPRSIYNKADEFKLLLDQYEADVVCISESWERENFTLSQLLQLENYRVISNVKQREFKGGKPAILVNEDKYHVKELCPDPITVPIGVEAVWALLTFKQKNPLNKVKYIAVGSIYYRGPKSTTKQELFDHIADTFHYLCSKYGAGIDFLIAGDTNRLNLSPILNLSPDLQQVVKLPTRLNPDRILDPIITTMKKFYCEPVTKPALNPNSSKTGKPSDHLVVIMEPITATLQIPPRNYKKVETRPINFAGLQKFSSWIESYSWTEMFKCTNVNMKAEMFQSTLLRKYQECFPVKVMKVCTEDRPWISPELKNLDRRRKREFFKNHKSKLWTKLNSEFEEKSSVAKQRYYTNIVSDLKETNTGKWYSKIKRMSGQDTDRENVILVEELSGYSDQEQADRIAESYAKISNQYDEIKTSDFPAYQNKQFCPPTIEPLKVHQTIKRMNMKAATITDDIPMKLISEFSVELATPLAHIYNCCLLEGIYPDIYKSECVTPAPKVFPPERMKDLRKISGLLNCSKIFEKLIGEYLISDMAPARDPSQYGNEKKLSIQHYLIKMLHQIFVAVDRNSQSEAFAVIIGMIDWAQAFDRQCHIIGVQSFIDNGVRSSLIPIMINYFQNRKMKVKWNGCKSSTQSMNGGGPQGGLLGIIEYLSQNNDCASFLSEDEKYKFIDDLSVLEIINLISVGISSYNCKQQVPNDIQTNNKFVPSQNFQTQKYLDQICDWTESKKMKLNTDKSKYMTVNFTRNYQFNTRLNMEGNLLQQVSETKLLGLVISDSLSWQSNTTFIVKKAYKRMIILQKLYEFDVPVEELLNIYFLYIRSVVESSAVVWHSSLTQGQEMELERVQKVALRIILKEDYCDYESALNLCSLSTLAGRRKQLCLTFAKKCTKQPKTVDMFPVSSQAYNIRNSENYQVTPANTDRLSKSAIPYMQRLLNCS